MASVIRRLFSLNLLIADCWIFGLVGLASVRFSLLTIFVTAFCKNIYVNKIDFDLILIKIISLVCSVWNLSTNNACYVCM